jgi:hypothetical protein
VVDERLRHLEREAAGGDLDTRARWLLDRVRAGRLPGDRLQLAAWLGDAAARLAVGEEPLARAARTKRDPWTQTLAGWGKEALVRAGLVVAKDELRHWRRHHKADAALPGLLDAVEAWAACPCDLCAVRVDEAAGDRLPAPRDNRSSRALAQVLSVAGIVRAGSASDWTASAVRALGESPPLPVRDAIREALVPWVLHW